PDPTGRASLALGPTPSTPLSLPSCREAPARHRGCAVHGGKSVTWPRPSPDDGAPGYRRILLSPEGFGNYHWLADTADGTRYFPERVRQDGHDRTALFGMDVLRGLGSPWIWHYLSS